MSVEVLVQMFNNTGGKMNVAACSAILDTLNSDGNLPKKPELDTTEAKLLALEIGHLDS